MSVRTQLVALLTPKLPDGWKLIPYQDNVDALDSVTVMLKQLSMKNTPEAPQGAYTFGYVATVVDPSQDMQTAEDALDDEVETLWQILESVSSIIPNEATKVSFGSAYMAYDITLDILTVKDAS